MAAHVRDYREYRHHFSSPENVVIFHFSIGSPVSKLFFRVPDKKIMIYHNITPHEFFLDSHRILTRECYKGRLELNLFKDKTDLALGDSEFNRRELELAGYHDMAELAELTPKAMGKFPNGMEFEIFTVTAEENRVLVESESHAVLANGTPYNNQYVFAFYFDDDGRILEFREYWDPLYAFETMFEGKTTL